MDFSKYGIKRGLGEWKMFIQQKAVLWLLVILFGNIVFAISEEDYFKVMGEIYFRFQKPATVASINEISRVVSISRITPNWIYAYANEKEFKNFLLFNIPYEVLEHPNFKAAYDFATKFSLEITNTQYPSYPEYISMMNQFQLSHPDICSLYEIGTSVQGRKILCAKITGLMDVFFKPRIFLTSTMHGNEPVGYVMMLLFVDYLLSNYGVDPIITHIIDRVEIWINPLSNPDGTYWAGDDTVFGARRYNANSVDLNRNFPDPAEGDHPDGNQFQPETIAMMNFVENTKPVLSANFHSGAELVNYPWDTWQRLHPDNDWFVSISRHYADTVHLNSPDGYFDDFDNGITNGFAWYRITGGRQDYMNYFQHCREITIELSDEFFPLSPHIYWAYNRDALIGLITEAFTGICGVVQCSENCPVQAKIEIPERDYDNSFVFSEQQTGKFFRLLLPGTYNIKFSSAYHYTEIIEDVNVDSGLLTVVNVFLEHATKGDISADRIIDITDVILCLRMALGLEPIDIKTSDINKDSIVDISDVILILRMSIGLT